MKATQTHQTYNSIMQIIRRTHTTPEYSVPWMRNEAYIKIMAINILIAAAVVMVETFSDASMAI